MDFAVLFLEQELEAALTPVQFKVMFVKICFK